jgi:membrane-associated phospholipid phosphatase
VSIYIISGRRWVSLPVFAFPVLNGISRLVLGVHTIIDVIGAFVLGLSVTLIVWRFRKSIYRWEDEKIF